MGKIVGMTQSNYIPWKGYFDYINSVDEFYFYDDVQYTKQDWRNRNLIKTPAGTEWLTVPVGSSRDRLICEVEIRDSLWQRSHWDKILFYYKNAPYFKMYREFFEEIFLGSRWTNLSDMNQTIIKRISRELLGITTKFGDSRPFNLTGKKAERYIPLLKEVGCTTFLSGPSAKNYLTEEMMAKEGIKLEWMNYEGYPEYHQLYPPFEHRVTILDLIFNEGPDMKKYMLSFKEKVEK
ncbi:WbqC family protein [Hydrogenimonas cancrithermarum]|nr:WbqC family protein [Hydrogenimonas cancrithermarum]